MENFLIFKILILPVAMIAPAFFAGSETALTSLSGISLLRLKSRHPSLKPLFDFWEHSPDKILATIIIGNTLATVFAGVLAASIGKDCAEIFGLSIKWTIPTASLVVTILVLIFGEILPKITGRLYSESFSRWSLVLLFPLTKVIHPVIQILVRIAGLFVQILGAEIQKEIPTLTDMELRGMLDTGPVTDSAVSSHHILKNILEFGQLRVAEVKKPREKIVAVELSRNSRELFAEISKLPYSRIPAYRDSLDNIVGIIYAKDLLTAWRTEGLILMPDLLRPVFFVSEDILISELLREFRKGHHHFAISRDSNNRVTGLITIEDVLEEITGEIYDETKIV